MSRNIPADVKRILRAETGFGCPVDGCGRPYLEWHHFDPPYHVEAHHRPEGMIALCREHHIQADNGAFTTAQLHAFKANGANQWTQIQGKFNWMRNRILAVVGGNFYYETPVIFQFNGKPIIWFERDAEGYMLININMLTTSGQSRAYIRANEWFNTGGEEDIECPPSAKKLKITYPNGDLVAIEFFELNSLADAVHMYPDANVQTWGIDFPITALEVTNRVANSGVEFGARGTRVQGISMKNNFSHSCAVGLAIG